MGMEIRAGCTVVVAKSPSEERFYQLRAQWYAWPEIRNLIAEDVEEHPEWGIRVYGSTIELVELGGQP